MSTTPPWYPPKPGQPPIDPPQPAVTEQPEEEVSAEIPVEGENKTE